MTTGKSQSVTIKNSGKLSDVEIDKMVKDAEKFKEEDARRQKIELVKQDIERTIDESQSQLDTYRDKIPADVAQRIEKAIT